MTEPHTLPQAEEEVDATSIQYPGVWLVSFEQTENGKSLRAFIGMKGGEFVYEGDLPISAAARLLFKFFVKEIGRTDLVERFDRSSHLNDAERLRSAS